MTDDEGIETVILNHQLEHRGGTPKYTSPFSQPATIGEWYKNSAEPAIERGADNAISWYKRLKGRIKNS